MSGFAQALLGSGGGSGALDRFIQRKATPVIPVPEAVVVQPEVACEFLQNEGPSSPFNLHRFDFDMP